MKRILFYFIIASFASSSQTLTQSFNEPVPGDFEYYYNLDTSAFSGPLPTGTGSNVTWNFTAAIPQTPLLTNTYCPVSAVPEATAFAGSTLVEKSAVFNTYIKSTTTPSPQTEVLGLTSSTMTINFTNSAIVARYPMGYGTSYADNVSGTFSAFGTSGTCSGKIGVSIDGAGTLNLPNGISLSNVVRLKSVQTVTITSGIIPLATIKETIINYYHSTLKFPVISIDYMTMSPITSSAITTAAVSGSTAFFVTGINENATSAGFKLFPNPAGDLINLELNNNVQPTGIKVHSLSGELIYHGEFTNKLDISGFTRGIYILEINTSKGDLHKIFSKS